MNQELREALTNVRDMGLDLGDCESALSRAMQAGELYAYGASTLLPAIAAERRAAARELRALGYSLSEMGSILGVTPARVAQIIKGPE